MNFRQLDYIIAVDKFRNFNRASIACDVAQSTLSREIQRLEKEFGMVIFDRSRNPVVPTLKGIDLIKKAKEIKFQQREFEQIALRKRNEVSGKMILAIAEILAPYIAPVLIKRITKKYPKLGIKILELSDRRIEDLLIAEEIDAAIMIDPSLTHGYFEQKIYEEKLCLYSTEKIMTNQAEVDIDCLNLKELILHEDLRNFFIRNQLKVGSSFFHQNKIHYLKGNLETLKNIINVNGGTMFLPQIATNYLSFTEQNNILFIKNEHFNLSVSLISSRGFEKNSLIRCLYDELASLQNQEKHF